MSDAWRMTAAAAVAAALALAMAPAARAAGADPWLGGLAQQLRKDPVAVSDSVSRAISAAELTRLRAAVRAMPVPTRVAIISVTPGDVNVFDLPDLIGGALDRPGLYVVTEASAPAFDSLHVTTVGVRTRVAPDDVERAVRDDVVPETRVAERVRYALRVAATGARPLRDVASRALDGDLQRDRENPNAVEDRAVVGGLGVGGVLGFVLPTARWWRRRPRRARPEHVGPVLREPGPDTAAKASTAVARLAAAIAVAQAPPDEVFDLYSAAAKADREAHTPVDHVGALVLAQDGEAVLAGRPRRRRCFFDPAHRGTTKPTRWRLGDEEAEVPACKRCVLAIEAGRAPDALGDRGRAYYERDTVWARTGLGTIDEELPQKVLAGR